MSTVVLLALHYYGILGLALGTGLTAPGTAQAPPSLPHIASPYLQLRHPAYPEIELLIERGVLNGLSPVVRPYRRVDVARALLNVDPLSLDGLERVWVARLTRELEGEIDQLLDGAAIPTLAVEAIGEGSARSQWHRDPLRPAGSGGVTGAAEADVRATFGIVAVETRLRSDNHYLHDPQFPGRVATNRFNQRAEDAYVEVQGRYVRAMIGRLYRNWATPRMQGTLLSDYAYSFDQVSLRIGNDALSMSLVTGRLDDFPGDVRRYLALHRLDVRPADNLALYLAEALLYQGHNRTFEIDFLNPVSLWITEHDNNRAQRIEARGNLLATAGLWWRLHGSLVLFGEFTLDDVQVDAVGEPPSYAFYTGLALPRLGPRAAARLSYSQVSNLAYRSDSTADIYAYRGVGLGRDLSDSDLLSAELDWYWSPSVRLTARVDMLRRGEGDFRDEWPDGFDNVPTIFSGTIESTLRVAVGGRAHVGDWATLEWEGGPSFVRNAGHVVGASRRRFVGRVGLRVRGVWRTELH